MTIVPLQRLELAECRWLGNNILSEWRRVAAHTPRGRKCPRPGELEGLRDGDVRVGR